MNTTFATVADEVEHLEASLALYLNLIDDSLAEGDEESAEELNLAHERATARLDALMAEHA